MQRRAFPQVCLSLQGLPGHMELALDSDPEGDVWEDTGSCRRAPTKAGPGVGITQAFVQSHWLRGSRLSSFIAPSLPALR